MVTLLVCGARGPGSIPGLAATISEIGYLLLPSRDMVEISLNRRKSSNNQPTIVLKRCTGKLEKIRMRGCYGQTGKIYTVAFFHETTKNLDNFNFSHTWFRLYFRFLPFCLCEGLKIYLYLECTLNATFWLPNRILTLIIKANALFMPHGESDRVGHFTSDTSMASILTYSDHRRQS